MKGRFWEQRRGEMGGLSRELLVSVQGVYLWCVPLGGISLPTCWFYVLLAKFLLASSLAGRFKVTVKTTSTPRLLFSPSIADTNIDMEKTTHSSYGSFRKQTRLQ
jgi:hypothetical protein